MTTITDAISALWDDVLTVVRLVGICFGRLGISGCICQFALTLQPLWRRISTDKKVLCKEGDPFFMLLSQLDALIVGWLEDGVNGAIEMINRVLASVRIFGSDAISWRLCLPVPSRPKRCENNLTPGQAAAFAKCEDPSLAGGLDMLCYYQRVHTICSSNQHLTEYNELFSKGYEEISELQHQFAEAFGDSYAYLDPTMADLVEQARISAVSGPDLEPRRDICSSSSFASAMSLDQIIISCMFALFESFCPDGTTRDDSFAFEIESTSFKLPKVRWDYSVSPPPPPPVTLAGIERLVEDDPNGWQLARSKIEDLFPTLSHVATSSVGASVGPYLSDYDISPQQITRAFLASVNLEKDSLGARVIESKHTGRWRFACMELFKLAKDYTSSGTRSMGYKRYGSKQQAVGHNGQFDRNFLLYAMLDIHLSLSGSDEYGRPYSYSTLDMYNFVCGDGNVRGGIPGPAGWRVATPYTETNGGIDIKGVQLSDFGPIVGYGSIELLRSMRIEKLVNCDTQIAPEDGVRYLVCEHGASRSMQLDLEDRADLSPFAMQRDSWCNPDQNMDIEDVVGNPFTFEEDLLDTSDRGRRRRLIFGQMFRFIGRNVLGQIPGIGGIIRAPFDLIDSAIGAIPGVGDIYKAGNDLIDGALEATIGQIPGVGFLLGSRRPGESDEDARSRVKERARSRGQDGNPSGALRRSGRPRDPSFLDNMRIPAADRGEENLVGSNGAFRKLSLMSWVLVTSSADDSVSPGMYRLKDLQVFRNLECRDFPEVTCSRELPSRDATVINLDKPLVDDADTWKTGKEAILRARCSAMISRESVIDIQCDRTPYIGINGCDQEDLQLGSRPWTYGPSHFLHRLFPTPSPSPPPPPPTPRPPPSPFPPHSPPIPYVMDDHMIKRLVREAEERVCTSVYYLGQTTRCNRLAIDLTERVLYARLSPPSAPPVSSSPPPPPPPPPLPLLPNELQPVVIQSAILSTYRMPIESASQPITDGVYTRDAADLAMRLSTLPQNKWACTPNSILACASGGLKDHCLNGAKRCASEAENVNNPFLDIGFRLQAGHYLWGLFIKLPSNDQLAENIRGDKTVQLFGPRNAPIRCAFGSERIVGVDEDRQVLIPCTPPDPTDAELYELGSVVRAVITLLGDRQIWFAEIQPIERDLRVAFNDTVTAPPPPLPPPPFPTPPPKSPSVQHNCTFHPGMELLPPSQMSVVEKEPCQLSSDECCKIAHNRQMFAYRLDDAGCCDVIAAQVAEISIRDIVDRRGRWTTRSGVGIVNE